MPLLIQVSHQTLFMQNVKRLPPKQIADNNVQIVTTSYAMSSGTPPPPVVEFKPVVAAPAPIVASTVEQPAVVAPAEPAPAADTQQE